MQSQRGEAFLLHKFALKSELGELIGIATKENKGLSDSVQALNSTIYNISTGNKETALFKVCDYGHCPQFCVNRKLQDSGFILESCFQI